MAINTSTWAWRVARPDDSGAVLIRSRRIYILPTKYGFLFAILLLAMLISAINYANNPAFLLTFMLSGVAANGMYYTWRNLLNIEIRWLGAEAVFAGEKAQLKFALSQSNQRSRPNIVLAFKGGHPQQRTDLPIEGRAHISLAMPTTQRGMQACGRLVISTNYPLGLFKAWSYLDPEAEVLVYPRPGKPWKPKGQIDYKGTEQGHAGVGTDDFVGLRGYRSSDSPGHIHWKSLASERGLLTKQFGGDRTDQSWLDWDETPGADDEQRLSALCRAVLDAHHQQQFVGLRLPTVLIPPGQDSLHQHQCLKALALFGAKNT